ncbi:MAG TPA: DinB family protein [Fimbriimonas sp.]|nr:DinB family protein [Fimbriimonas sp.]
MNEREMLREVAVGFEYSYQHDDWITPLDEALEGLSAVQASWKWTPDSKCIWEIVLHLAVWNQNMVDRVRTREQSRPVEGAWPSLPPVCDEAGWEAAKERLRDALRSFEQMLETTTLDEIQASPYGLADLLCRLTHNGYHLGQISKMREWMAW